MDFGLLIAIIGGIILWIASASEKSGKKNRAKALKEFYSDDLDSLR